MRDEGTPIQMRNFGIAALVSVAALLIFGPTVFAQRPGLEVPVVTPGQGWKACPRRENDAHVADDRKKANVDTHTFDAHDISGVWGNNGIPIDLKARPPFTPEGQKIYDALAKQIAQPDYNTVAAKDPLLTCDPLGGYEHSDTTMERSSCNYRTEFCNFLSGVTRGGPFGPTGASCP